MLGFTQRFRDFFSDRRVSIRVATARGRQMSLPPAAALLAAGRGGSGAGLERFPRGPRNGCASGPSVGLTRPARPRTCPARSLTCPARPLTCPRPAPHLRAPRTCTCTRTAPHLHIGVPPPVSALRAGTAGRELGKDGAGSSSGPGGRVLGVPAGSWTRPGVRAVKGEAAKPQLTSYNCGRHLLPKGSLRRNNVWTDQSFGNKFL